MPGCPEQFRMGVTHIELGQPTLAVLTDDGFSGESVLDLSSGRGCLHTSEPSRSEAHVSQGNPSPVRKGTYSDDFPATESRLPTPESRLPTPVVPEVARTRGRPGAGGDGAALGGGPGLEQRPEGGGGRGGGGRLGVVARAWSKGPRGVRANRSAPAATRERSPKMNTAAITAPATRPATTSPI